MTNPSPVHRMKRSTSLTLTAMAGAGLTLSACDQHALPPPQPVQAVAYASLDQCKLSKEVPAAECDKAFAAARADDGAHAPRYAERSTCEDTYGPGNCVPRGSGGNGSFFTPLLTGFVIGRMLDGGGQPYYRGTGLYRDNGGGYVTGFGGHLDRDYRTGRTSIDRRSIDPPAAIREAPPRVQTRTSVVSRGGFGGGSRSFGGSSHGFGG